MADRASSSEAISQVQNKILVCYSAAKDAETAGANITSLMATLNQAALLLDRAQLAQSDGNFNLASEFSLQSLAKLDTFLFDAYALKNAGEQQRTLDFWINLVSSIAGAIAVIVVGVVVWIWMQRKNMKIGAVANGSSKA